VSCHLVELERDYPPYEKGSVWAEPDAGAAAEILRQVYEHPEEGRQRGRIAKQEIIQKYGVKPVGEMLAKRIEGILGRGRETVTASVGGRSPYFIKEGYIERSPSEQSRQSGAPTAGLIHQPLVYPFAAHLARCFGCSHLIDLGCGQAHKLAALSSEFHVIGLDLAENIAYCRGHYAFGEWIEWDLDQPAMPPLSREVVRDAVIICADVIEHLARPEYLLDTLRVWLDDAPAAVLSTPERDLVHGPEHKGPPPNPCHIREWNRQELQQFLESRGLRVEFAGLTLNNDVAQEKKTSLFVLGNSHQPALTPAPPDFRVVAIMNAYNEADIIVPSLNHLIESGVEVYLIDNWSTDGTAELARAFLGHGLIGIEQFPPGGRVCHHWGPQLRRVEELAHTMEGDWFIHHDVDEIREAPWPGVSLRDALYHVEQCGFNCVDHTLINFRPVDNSFVPGSDFGHHFRYWEPGKNPGHFEQMKAWKKTEVRVSLAESGGHCVQFPGKRVFPYKFLTRHYPIRSQAHGERKILQERKGRRHPEEQAKGWSIRYDSVEEGHSFLHNSSELMQFDPSTFYITFLVERLSGIGFPRQERPTL